MSQVVGPLFSLNAKGKWGNTLTFTSAFNRNIVKKTPRTKLPASGNQLGVRKVFSDGIVAWNGLPIEEKEEYNQKAKGKSLTGFDIFISDYMNENLKKLGWGKYGAGKYGVNKYGEI